MLKRPDPVCTQYNLQTNMAMFQSIGSRKTYMHNIHPKPKYTMRQVIIVCDNVQVLYLLCSSLPSLGKSGSDLNVLSKKVKKEIDLTNITGMWIKGHQKNVQRTSTETLFKNCNEITDNLASVLTKSIDNLLMRY